MNMISQNVQVNHTVDSTIKGNDGTEIMPRTIWLSKLSLIFDSLWEEGSQGCKLPWATSAHKLALKLGKEKKWTRRRILLVSRLL